MILMISNRYLIALFFLPLISFGQWVRPYVTGEGLGYVQGSKHSSFYGIVEDDRLTVLGWQNLGPRHSPRIEYIRDVYDAKIGRLFASEILYPYDGSPTAHRPGQRFFPNANGFIVSHRTMGSYTDSLHYLRDKYGNVQRIDSLWYTLIVTRQRVDSTHSYLVKDTSRNLILRDWYTTDTILFICDTCISKVYQGPFDPSQFILAQYHNDGAILYLSYWQPGMVSYGFDILKFDISTGAYLGHTNFIGSFGISSGQAFRVVVEDSVSLPTQSDETYTSYNRIVDGNGQVLARFNYDGYLFQGRAGSMSRAFFNDSLFIISSDIHDVRGNSVYLKGSHLRVFNLKGQEVSAAKIFNSVYGINFQIEQILAVENGFIYFNTTIETGTPGYDLLASIPLDLDYNDSLIELNLMNKYPKVGELNVYPNPFTDSVKIKSSRPYDQILISSIDGRQLISANYSEGNAYTTEALKSGAYMVTVLFQGKVIHSSLVVKE